MKKLLIVDDDRSLLSYLESELREVGFSVKSSDNGADAIVTAAEEEFDLILLDMLMPGLDGIQVVRVLRKISPHIPVIGLTGYVGRGYMSQAQSLGVSLLTKPIEIQTLISEIKETIKQAEEKNIQTS